MWGSRLNSVLACAGMAASVALAPAAQASMKTGDQVAIPEVRLMDGTVLPEGHFKGKPVVVEYWASWCPYCGRQNPYIQKLWEQAKGKGLEILTVSIDKKSEDAAAYLQKKNYTFPVAMETPALREVFGKPKVIPIVYIIKPDGKVVEVIPGEMFEEDVLGFMKYAPKAGSALPDSGS